MEKTTLTPTLPRKIRPSSQSANVCPPEPYPRIAPPVCPPAPDGLVGWWPGEGGFDFEDVAGTNDGVAVNAVSFASGNVGQAIVFCLGNCA